MEEIQALRRRRDLLLPRLLRYLPSGQVSLKTN
jgi:hypothetical protein